MNIVVVLLFVVLAIGFVSVLINRGRAETEALEETQPMVPIMSDEESMLLAAAAQVWAVSRITSLEGTRTYIVDVTTGNYLFAVDESAKTVVPIAKKPVVKKQRRTVARTH